MYGTIARLRLKPDTREQFARWVREHSSPALPVPGAVASSIYQMDRDPDECFLVALFDSRESYVANANSPEQDARYRELLELLEGEPEWHDGTVISALEYDRAAAAAT